MGISSIEDPSTTCCLSPKIYQPAEDAMEAPKKKKMFSSSSFYAEPSGRYPTVEEQVKLCRSIAASLSDRCNQRSKGASMFFKRVKKAEKWIVAESAVLEEERSEEDRDPASLPYVRPRGDGPPRLKLLMAPRQTVDMDELLRQGVDIVQHDAMSPQACQGLVRDLVSTKGRGGQLFAKRKKKSEEWVVDEEKVKQQLQARYQESGLPDLDSQIVAETVIRAAEAKVMTYPMPHLPVIESLDSGQAACNSEAYRVRVPRGWTNSSPLDVESLPNASADSEVHQPTTIATPLRRVKSFNNFNTSPRAWDAQRYSQFRPVRPVKPPSLLMVQ